MSFIIDDFQLHKKRCLRHSQNILNSVASGFYVVAHGKIPTCLKCEHGGQTYLLITKAVNEKIIIVTFDLQIVTLNFLAHKV